jgi:hypothetical protein
MKGKNIVGQKFGQLTVLERAGTAKDRHVMWLCKCTCGNTTTATGTRLRSGETQSCGCLNKEINRAKAMTHGMKGTRLYDEWRHMKDRCSRPKSRIYKNYGGRGITVCQEWRENFETFRDWALANGYQDDLTIHRIDVNGNYEPSNCRWIALEEQQNNRRNNRLITHEGKTQTMKQWAKEKGIPYNTLRARLNRGWPTDRALNDSIYKNGRKFCIE